MRYYEILAEIKKGIDPDTGMPYAVQDPERKPTNGGVNSGLDEPKPKPYKSQYGYTFGRQPGDKVKLKDQPQFSQLKNGKWVIEWPKEMIKSSAAPNLSQYTQFDNLEDAEKLFKKVYDEYVAKTLERRARTRGKGAARPGGDKPTGKIVGINLVDKHKDGKISVRIEYELYDSPGKTIKSGTIIRDNPEGVLKWFRRYYENDLHFRWKDISTLLPNTPENEVELARAATIKADIDEGLEWVAKKEEQLKKIQKAYAGYDRSVGAHIKFFLRALRDYKVSLLPVVGSLIVAMNHQRYLKNKAEMNYTLSTDNSTADNEQYRNQQEKYLTDMIEIIGAHLAAAVIVVGIKSGLFGKKVTMTAGYDTYKDKDRRISMQQWKDEFAEIMKMPGRGKKLQALLKKVAGGTVTGLGAAGTGFGVAWAVANNALEKMWHAIVAEETKISDALESTPPAAAFPGSASILERHVNQQQDGTGLNLQPIDDATKDKIDSMLDDL